MGHDDILRAYRATGVGVQYDAISLPPIQVIKPTIKGRTVYIYSGIEDFIQEETYSTNFKYANQDSPEYIRAWYKIILRDTTYVVKTNSNSAPPFCTATLNGVVEFTPPD